MQLIEIWFIGMILLGNLLLYANVRPDPVWLTYMDKFVAYVIIPFTALWAARLRILTIVNTSGLLAAVLVAVFLKVTGVYLGWILGMFVSGCFVYSLIPVVDVVPIKTFAAS
jgi:hypothetical protein